jgi:endoglucanase
LHTDGRWIVDANDCPFTFHSVNWYGAEELDYVPAGLERQDIHTIAHEIRGLGANSVRLLWSNEMYERNPVIDDPRVLAANPNLLGQTALQVLDAVIDALAQEGLMVILDNHTSDAGWCCSNQDGNGLWYNDRYPEASWFTDWQGMAQRYLSQPAVVAVDLRNEPRCDGTLCATWGGPANTDWRAAAERGGDAVLATNPNLLVIVEGISYAGSLQGAATDPVQLSIPDQLVYSAHDYPWYHSGYNSIADVSWDLDRHWGFLLDDSQSYAAPVYVGEFGTCHTAVTCYQGFAPNSYGLWYQAVLQYLSEHQVDWAYWALNGTQARAPGRTFGAPEGYGLLNPNWDGPAQPDQLAPLQSILGLSRRWADTDIGSVGYQGSAGQAGKVYAVRGSGADIADFADAFHFVYQPLAGDGSIVARVQSLQDTDQYAKAGVMIRSALNPFASQASVVVTAGNGIRFLRRVVDGGGSVTSGVAGSAPAWVALVRRGDTFTGYTSTDGTDWLEVGSVVIPMPAVVYVGLAVTSRTNTALNTAVFDRVHVTTVRGRRYETEIRVLSLTQAAGSPSTPGLLLTFPDEVASVAADSGWEALARAVQAGQGQTPARRDDADNVLAVVRAGHTEDASMEMPPLAEFMEQAAAVRGLAIDSF